MDGALRLMDVPPDDIETWLAAQAEAAGFKLMVGCMVSTSLAIAPAMLIAQRADVVDLDGALLLACDRPQGLRYAASRVHPAEPALWG